MAAPGGQSCCTVTLQLLPQLGEGKEERAAAARREWHRGPRPHLGEPLDVLLVERGQALLHQPHVVVPSKRFAVLIHQVSEF